MRKGARSALRSETMTLKYNMDTKNRNCLRAIAVFFVPKHERSEANVCLKAG